MTPPHAMVLLAFCLIFGNLVCFRAVFGVDMGRRNKQVDLIEGLNLHNTTYQGVTLVPGLHSLTPALYFQGDYRELKMPEVVFSRVVELLQQHNEFTVLAFVRQEDANSGSIISFSHGYHRYFELQSSGRKNEIRLHYTHTNSVCVETFPYRLANNKWHKLALSVSGNQVELYIDCHKIYQRVLWTIDRNFTIDGGNLSLWIGQRNNKHFLYKGTLQEVKIVAGTNGYLEQCPQLDSTCPTCGEFTALQATVTQLQRHVFELTARLQEAETRINKVEECDCQRSCRVNGSVHADGATWQEGCEICACVTGEIKCRPIQCPKITCKNPVYAPNECCPTCLMQCYLRGVLYDHGVSVSPRQCVVCECFNGSMRCRHIDPETMCPPLPCPIEQQFSIAGECCKFCPGVDYCAKGHTCHANATCLNLQTTYACQCISGFQGDGHLCHDIDECQEKGGLDGHHCNSNTRCVNSPGSYVCECLPGYRRLDKFNCVEHDECSSGDHACDDHARCLNTQGSYSCQCLPGYVGDGYTCTPVCNQTCLNGGECVSPGECKCKKGYVGPSCELDMDECALGLHQCHPNADCVNMPGWYYCQCKSGFRSIMQDHAVGAICQDIDECAEGTHTCHHTALCNNAQGSYECLCQPGQNDCSRDCVFEGLEFRNHDVWEDHSKPCSQCSCSEGTVTCKEMTCNCHDPKVNLDCCPQCDISSECPHQEVPRVTFKNGEQWIYQCQTCECLHGEIDCWPMECPPVVCRDPVLLPGDCCPRCLDDPCGAEHNVSDGADRPCTYLGRLHASGSQWELPQDKCTSCKCRVPICDQLDGRLCCSVAVDCYNADGADDHNGGNRDVDFQPVPGSPVLQGAAPVRLEEDTSSTVGLSGATAIDDQDQFQQQQDVTTSVSDHSTSTSSGGNGGGDNLNTGASKVSKDQETPKYLLSQQQQQRQDSPSLVPLQQTAIPDR